LQALSQHEDEDRESLILWQAPTLEIEAEKAEVASLAGKFLERRRNFLKEQTKILPIKSNLLSLCKNEKITPFKLSFSKLIIFCSTFLLPSKV